jgi:multidrug resistance efflux pump
MKKEIDTENPEQGNALQLINNLKWSRMLARWTASIFILFVLALFLPWTQNIESVGKLTTLRPQDRPQELHTVIAGRIEEWFTQEGQYVSKGDTIVRISEVKEKFLDTNLLTRLQEQIDAKKGSRGSYNEKVTALSTQIMALQQGQVLSIQKTRNKLYQSNLKVKSDSSDVIATQAEYTISLDQQRRADSLYKKGLISLTDFERRRLKLQEVNAKRISLENKLLSSRNEVLNAHIELSSIEAEYLDKTSKAESELNTALSYLYEMEGEIAKMNNDYMNTYIRQGFYFITAPQNGYVVQARVQGVGETVKEGDVIVTVMPATPQLTAELYVNAMDIPLLQKGRKVRLQFDGWPALVFSGWPGYSFGTFGGTVAVIDNIDTKGKYRVLVVADENEKPWPSQLRVGSGVRGWALLNDVPVWYELWRQLNGFPADYMGNEEPDSIKKEK